MITPGKRSAARGIGEASSHPRHPKGVHVPTIFLHPRAALRLPGVIIKLPLWGKIVFGE